VYIRRARVEQALTNLMEVDGVESDPEQATPTALITSRAAAAYAAPKEEALGAGGSSSAAPRWYQESRAFQS
jgi:hypothetical protein